LFYQLKDENGECVCVGMAFLFEYMNIDISLKKKKLNEMLNSKIDSFFFEN